ncbi:hypothetical protein [Bradyrhizobium sp. SZCCHNRI20481]|uniref:hypothetical protein n=1 Tax=Bradyrhizobium sp. SZCCHNRI20481 TaxID=3057286 RepID=UPI002916933F|nr:hypothetical protein [Bradyrhizobium sp. SZCCHNRI20481]
MPALKNTKHEAFANLVAKRDKTKMSVTVCYIASGYSTDGHAAEASATRLLSSAEVQARIAEINAPVVAKSRVTVASLLAELQATVEAARAAKQFGAVNGSLALIGKLTGLLVEKVEMGGPGEFADAKTPADILRALAEDCGSVGELIEQLEFMLDEARAMAAGQARPIAVVEHKSEDKWKKLNGFNQAT